MSEALDRFKEYLDSISDEQLKKDLIELGIEEWEENKGDESNEQKARCSYFRCTR